MTRLVRSSWAVLLTGCFDPEPPPESSHGGSTDAAESSSGASSISSATSSSSGATTAGESGDGTESTTTSGGSSSDSSDAESTTHGGSDTGAHMCVVDGMIGEGEQCDDANEEPGDGCSDCAVEDGFGCANEPSLCFPACDPLVQDCAQGSGCYPADPVFVCAPDGSGRSGQLYTDCANINGCDPGLVCIDAGIVPGCDNPGGGCCSQLCDLAEPACPDMLGCTAVYAEGTAPDGLDDVGVCTG